MNILVINGSPRQKGLASQMLGIMLDEAETRGDTMENTLLLGQHSWTDEVDV